MAISVPLLVGILTWVGACARPPLLERAIRARGGPLTSLVRTVEADVHVGFPGVWQARTAYRFPDRWALTVETTGEAGTYTWDGSASHIIIGSRTMAIDASPTTPLRSQARFWAAVYLDAIRLPGIDVVPLAVEALPQGVVEGIEIVRADDGSRYRIGVNARTQVVWAEGPVVIPPFGRTELTVRFADHQRTGRFVLPRRAAYSVGGTPILEERTLAACPDDPATSDEAFRDPSRFPDCGIPSLSE